MVSATYAAVAASRSARHARCRVSPALGRRHDRGAARAHGARRQEPRRRMRVRHRRVPHRGLVTDVSARPAARRALCAPSGAANAVSVGVVIHSSSARPLATSPLRGSGALRRVVAGGLLGIHLHARVRGNEVVRNRHLLDHGDALGRERVVLHVAHRRPAVDARDAEPMEDVGHELLEAHVLHAGHAFGALEVRRRAIAADLALPCVVDEELRHLAERAAFLAVVDDEPHAALLRHLDADLDAVREIGPARADVGAEHVRAVALVVHAAGDLGGGAAQRADVAEEIERHAADRRQEHVQIGPRDELRKHASRLLEQHAPQLPLGDVEAPRDARQMPDRIDRRLRHAHVAVVVQDRSVRNEAPGRDGVLQLRHVDPRLGDRDRRPQVDARGELRGKRRRDHVAPRIERHDLVRIGPLRMRSDHFRRRRVREVRPMVAVEPSGGDRERAIERVGARVRADRVALRGIGEARHDRPALRRARGAPFERRRLSRRAPERVGGQYDVARHVEVARRSVVRRPAS